MLDLSHNPFVCTCALYWFRRQWIPKNQGKLRKYPEEYNCESPQNMKSRQLQDHYPTQAECLNPLVVMAIVLTASVVVILATGIVLYKYRWHIRYYFYLIRIKMSYQSIPDEFQYDAFVAYNSVDRAWVLTQLMPFMEKQQKFKLCLHDRDFEVGKLIVDNIIENTRKSRKLILILSKSFSGNEWCQFESSVAHRRLMEEGATSVILVLLEDLTSRHMTGTLGVLLQSTCTIEWTNNRIGRKLFWKELLGSLD